MQLREVKIAIPQDIYFALDEDENELGVQMRRMLAIQFYLKKKLTIGKAAQLAGISKFEFETLLSENQIPISLLTKEDVMADVKKIDK